MFDSGDLELCFGRTELALHDIEEIASQILEDGKFPLLIGGEHLVTLASVNAVARKYPDLHIIQFDAHADLRSDYLGAELSHACVMRRVYELTGDGRIHQFCIRSGVRSEFQFAREHTDMTLFNLKGLDTLTQSLKISGTPVYFTIDLDCLDPSAFPGTGTPEAGGITFKELIEAIFKVCETKVVGADINELAPAPVSYTHLAVISLAIYDRKKRVAKR